MTSIVIYLIIRYEKEIGMDLYLHLINTLFIGL